MKEETSLNISNFYYPIKYCRIIGKTLIDPSLSEQVNSEVEVTVIKDLKQIENNPIVIHRTKSMLKNQSSEEVVNSILAQWVIDISRIVKSK